MLRDEAGDDRYAADWYAQGMGLDVAVGVMFDDAGDDAYTARGGSQGAATANGFGLLAGGEGRFELAAAEHGWGRAEWLRGMPSVALLLHGNGAQFIRAGEAIAAPPDNPPIAVEAPSAQTCPSAHPGEALVCRVRDAPDLEAVWRELKAQLANDALAGWIAIALGQRPPPPPLAEEIAAGLAARESCNVRETGGLLKPEELQTWRLLHAAPQPYTRERWEDTYNWTVKWNMTLSGATYENTVDNRAWQ